MRKELLLKRIDDYEKKLEFINMNIEVILKEVKKDIYDYKKKNIHKKYTSIKLEEIQYIIQTKNLKTYLFNLMSFIIFDYYLALFEGKIDDEILDSLNKLFINICFRTTNVNSKYILNLRPIRILGNSTKEDELYYINKYFQLFSNKNILYNSEIFQEECFRQYCILVINICIQEKNNMYLRTFFLKNKKFISTSYLVESLTKQSNNDISYFDNIDLSFCNFVNELQYDIESNYVMCSPFENINNGKIDNTSNGLCKILKTHEELIKYINDLVKDNILYNYLSNYIMSEKSNIYFHFQSNNKDKTQYSIFLITRYYLNFINANDDIELISKLIYREPKEISFNNDATDLSTIKEDSCWPYVSTWCFLLLQVIMDFLINIDKKDIISIFKDENKLKIFLYNTMNLYLRLKDCNYRIIDNKNNNIEEFFLRIDKKQIELEDTFIATHRYISTELNASSKEKIVKNFFESAFDSYKLNGNMTNCLMEYSNCQISKTFINNAYSAIEKNDALIDQIVSGEIIVKPFILNNDYSLYAIGDYTNLVVCQIKSIERYIKEVLIQYHYNNIYKTKINGTNKDNYGWCNLVDDGQIIFNGRTADDLKKLECGSALYALKYAYILENANCPIRFEMYSEFIKKVRNNHLHIERIQTMEEALKLRIQTAYWLMYIIVSLEDKGILQH